MGDVEPSGTARTVWPAVWEVGVEGARRSLCSSRSRVHLVSRHPTPGRCSRVRSWTPRRGVAVIGFWFIYFRKILNSKDLIFFYACFLQKKKTTKGRTA